MSAQPMIGAGGQPIVPTSGDAPVSKPRPAANGGPLDRWKSKSGAPMDEKVAK